MAKSIKDSKVSGERDYSVCTFRTLVPNPPPAVQRMLNRALASLGTDLNVLKRWTEPVLTNDGSDEKTHHLARWMLERQAEPNLLARDAGRLFLGRDMACAQCHDHPRVDDYFQRDYHGLAAFFGRTSLFQPDPNKPGMVTESATGEAAWEPAVIAAAKGILTLARAAGLRGPAPSGLE
jgi:hypothetical protein